MVRVFLSRLIVVCSDPTTDVRIMSTTIIVKSHHFVKRLIYSVEYSYSSVLLALWRKNDFYYKELGLPRKPVFIHFMAENRCKLLQAENG